MIPYLHWFSSSVSDAKKSDESPLRIITDGTCILSSLIDWSRINALKGDITKIIQSLTSIHESKTKGKSWNIKDFPYPVGKTTKTPFLFSTIFLSASTCGSRREIDGKLRGRRTLESISVNLSPREAAIDRMQIWPPTNYSFVLVLISVTSLVLQPKFFQFYACERG